MLMIPDINHLILPLVAHRHCHNIQNGGYYLSLAISTRPTNGLFASAERLLLGDPFNQLTSHVIDLDGDTGGWYRVKEMAVWVLKLLLAGEKTRGWQVNESGFKLAESSA